MKINIFLITFLSFFLLNKILAQNSTQNKETFYTNKVLKAPESVFKMFSDAGMQPANHELTSDEQQKVNKAYDLLPPLYKKILQEHLLSISFMDNMPNTALTSSLDTEDSSKLFNITFRAGILNETISEWATWKENSAFDFSLNTNMKIQVDAGDLDAIQYILLHEATHVVDAVLTITPHADKAKDIVKPTTFTKNIWQVFNKPISKYTNPTLENSYFRNRKVQPILSATAIYASLKKTPFASLYSMASWYEDIAELISIYHLTQKLHQPYKVNVIDDDVIIGSYEPMQNKLVKKRIKNLRFLYQH